MTKKEVRYLVNYRIELLQVIRKYDLMEDMDRLNCVDDIKDILIVDMDLCIKNNCTTEFKQIISILIDKIDKLQSYNLEKFLSYTQCIVDMLEIFENETYVNI